MAKRKTIKAEELEHLRNRLAYAEEQAAKVEEHGGSEFNEGYHEAMLTALYWLDDFMEENNLAITD